MVDGEFGDKEGRTGEGVLAVILREGRAMGGGVEAAVERAGDSGGENRDDVDGEEGAIGTSSSCTRSIRDAERLYPGVGASVVEGSGASVGVRSAASTDEASAVLWGNVSLSAALAWAALKVRAGTIS